MDVDSEGSPVEFSETDSQVCVIELVQGRRENIQLSRITFYFWQCMLKDSI